MIIRFNSLCSTPLIILINIKLFIVLCRTLHGYYKENKNVDILSLIVLGT